MEGSIRGPEGYPPPTLVRKRTSKGVRVVLLLVLALLAGAAFMVAGRLFDSAPEPAAPTEIRPAEPLPVPAPAPSADAEAPPAEPAAPAVVVETPEQAMAAAPPSVDARQPNQWYYVRRLGDGPGAIYSRTGGQWNYAFACNRAARTIEIIAVGTGDPAGFDRQAIEVGATRLAMDATYSRDAGGMISATLPAGDAFFAALDGSAPMAFQLVAGRKVIVPVGPELVRLIRTCRG